MHVDLIATTKGTKMIHGTENGKKTACGINLTRPENLGLYTTAGEMNDIMQLTCDKCKTLIAKKQIKESNKEMAAQLKAEQKALKRERALEKHNHGHAQPAAPQQPDAGKGGAYVPPSMRKSMAAQEKQKPIDAPAPEIPTPVSMPAPNVGAAPIPSPAPMPAPAPQNDVLAQFAIPQVPTSVPGMTPPSAPMPAPAPAPSPAPVDDVLAQFAIPQVPSSVPGMTPPHAPIPAPAPAPSPAPVDDVLAQFAIPKVPTSVPGMTPPPAPIPAPAPAPSPVPADDVLAQFAIPSVPSAPAAGKADDLLAQFSIPKPGKQPAPAPAVPEVSAPSGVTSPDDILAQFSHAPQTGGQALDSLANSLFGGQPAPEHNAEGQVTIEIPTVEQPAARVPEPIAEPEDVIEVTPTPVEDDYDPFSHMHQPAPQPASDGLDDLLVVPEGMKVPDHPSEMVQTDFPTLTEPTVPTAPPVSTVLPTLEVPGVPAVPAAAAVPTLDVPPVPPAPPIPEMPVPPMQQPVYPTAAAIPQGFGLPAMPQAYAVPQPAVAYPQMPYGQVPVQPIMGYPYPVPAAPATNFFAVPPAAKKTTNTKPPLFVGYSADGRQLFQTYDELGNPIPINEPVYNAPPETPRTAPVPSQATSAPAAGVPVMDLDDLMASMGIEDPKKKKKDEGKAINYTEYHIPEKKKKKPATPAKPASAMPDVPTGPISAAEAKRRKKVDKINKEFEKQLRARGIDPRTGGIMVDPDK